jgi:hypothetical protein
MERGEYPRRPLRGDMRLAVLVAPSTKKSQAARLCYGKAGASSCIVL